MGFTPGIQSVLHTSPLKSVSSPARMTAVLALLITVLSLSLAQDTVLDWEMQAFQMCETDLEEGLTWDEVKACEEKYPDLLAEKDLTEPTEEDFHASDLNNDGVLMFDEWKEWAGFP